MVISDGIVYRNPYISITVLRTEIHSSSLIVNCNENIFFMMHWEKSEHTLASRKGKILISACKIVH